jgi:hypothetical protein
MADAAGGGRAAPVGNYTYDDMAAYETAAAEEEEEEAEEEQGVGEGELRQEGGAEGAGAVGNHDAGAGDDGEAEDGWTTGALGDDAAVADESAWVDATVAPASDATELDEPYAAAAVKRERGASSPASDSDPHAWKRARADAAAQETSAAAPPEVWDLTADDIVLPRRAQAHAGSPLDADYGVCVCVRVSVCVCGGRATRRWTT